MKKKYRKERGSLPPEAWTPEQKKYIQNKIREKQKFSWSDIHEIRKEMIRDFSVNRTLGSIVVGMRTMGKEIGFLLHIGDKICARYSKDEKSFLESLIKDDPHFSLERLNHISDTMERPVTGLVSRLVRTNRNVTVDSRFEAFRLYALQKLDNPNYKPDKKKITTLPPNKEGKTPLITERFPQQSELTLVKKKLTPVAHPDDPDALQKALDRVMVEANAIRKSRAEIMDEYQRLKTFYTNLVAENNTLRQAFALLQRKTG
jgi:hypothetical protein